MLTVKVRSLMDTHLNTGVKEYNISAGQVFICELKAQEVLDDLILLHILEKVDEGTPEAKPLPVFYPEPAESSVLLNDLGEEIPLSGGLEPWLDFQS